MCANQYPAWLEQEVDFCNVDIHYYDLTSWALPGMHITRYLLGPEASGQKTGEMLKKLIKRYV